MIKYDFIAFAACNINNMSNSVTICLLFTCIMFTVCLLFPASQLGSGAYLQPHRLDNGHSEEITTNGHGYINRDYTTKDVLCFFSK
jgi:hypothetical protein